jgi:hypothetical protein
MLDGDRHIFSGIKGLPDAAGLGWTALDRLNAAIRHVNQVDIGHHFEELARNMVHTPVAA